MDDTDLRPRARLSALLRDSVYSTPLTILRGIALAQNSIFIVFSIHIVRRSVHAALALCGPCHSVYLHLAIWIRLLSYLFQTKNDVR
jgi:hypothetical protein